MIDQAVRDMLRETAVKVLDARVRREDVAAWADAATASFDRPLWREMASLGWLGLGLRESQGGAAGGSIRGTWSSTWDEPVLLERGVGHALRHRA